jgi:predicted GNAT family N-acyltransferase
MTNMNIVEITTSDTHPLRLAVLRENTPTRDVTFPEDDLPGVIHLGVRHASGLLIATSSWVPKECPHALGRRGVQLRGMATSIAHQGTGVGGLLLEAGLQRHANEGFEVMWARARDSALNFYIAHGCAVVGDGFVDQTTQLEHHVVVRHLPDLDTVDLDTVDLDTGS